MSVARVAFLGALLISASSLPAIAYAQPQLEDENKTEQTTAPARPLTPEEQRAEDLRQLEELRATRQSLERQMGNFDARIRAIEERLGVPEPPQTVQQVPTFKGGEQASAEEKTRPGGLFEAAVGNETFYEPGKGFILVRDDDAELGAGVFSYVRYLNQTTLEPTYIDSFGRTKQLADIRNDIEFQKLSFNFKGWLFDPKFRYYFFFWTSNSQMGEGAQVVLGGYFQYQFAKWLTVTAGVMPLPTTRSTNYSFPNWLRNDNRVMADEFFRGSYTTGIDALGEIAPGLRYRVALGNNLAQLGVSSQELDAKFNTLSAVLTWMPTTYEFGPASGFGDYEHHDKLATLFAVHYTRSREDAQGQPEEDDFENSQIRLSDGTLLFSPDPFGTGGKIEKATYQMLALEAAAKYKGFSLEGEYYFRWVDNFKTIGFIPVTELFDHGFTLQGSAMILPKQLQAYVTASKIFGEYGNPTELGLGLIYYPFKRKEVRWNVQALRLDNSPVGGSSIPAVVGGDGWVFSSDFIVAF